MLGQQFREGSREMWRPGDMVIVSQDDGIRRAVVVEDTGRPTTLKSGTWVDVDSGCGVEGMPSYLLVMDPNPQTLESRDAS